MGGPLGSSIFDDEDFLLSGIADIEYEYDYDTGEFLGLKEDNEETTEAPVDSNETTTEVPADEDSTELNVTDNEVDVGDPRRPKALDEDEEEEEFDPYKRVKVGCCWYAAIQIADNQKSRQPKSLGFENQSTSQRLRGGRNLGNRKRRPRKLRKSKLPLDRVITSLNNLISKGLKSLLVQHQPQKPPVPRRPFHRPN